MQIPTSIYIIADRNMQIISQKWSVIFNTSTEWSGEKLHNDFAIILQPFAVELRVLHQNAQLSQCKIFVIWLNILW